MKAVVFHEHGGPDVLSYQEVPDPVAKSDEVLIEVKATSLNHLDIWIRQGIPAYKINLPHISGSDAAGIIASKGKSVKKFKVGDRVFVSPSLACFRCPMCRAGHDNICQQIKIFGASDNGGYAQLAKAKALHVHLLPKNISFEQGAAFPLAGVTAWHMLVTRAGLKKGQTVLVLAAGSGVGSMAIQIAKAFGAKVIATVGSTEKIIKAKAIGADHVVMHAQEDFSKEVWALTKKRGVDIVFEHVGPQTWQSSINCLSKGGTLVTCGATTGPLAHFDIRYLFTRELNILGAYGGTKKELMAVTRLVAEKKLVPMVDRIYPLEEAKAAQEQLLLRRFFGKIVLKP